MLIETFPMFSNWAAKTPERQAEEGERAEA